METKYYTPGIEEFYIGFECEWQSKIRNETWNKQVCDMDLISIAFDSYEHSDWEEPFNEQFRVKYLDKEDIESLGFIHKYKANLDDLETEEHSCNPYQYLLKDVSFCNSSRNVDIKMTYLGTPNNPGIIRLQMYERNYFEWYTVFEGRIRNKSELKQVLKMIGAN